MGGPKGKAAGKGKGGGKESGKGKSKKGDDAKATEKGGKGGESAPVYSTDGRPYEAQLKELYKSTAVRLTDIDAKAVQLLDALHEAGKADAACTFLTKSLEGVAREKVANWKAYVFTLLRGYDSEVYNNMKSERGRPRPRREKKEVVITTELKVGAPEFVPGQAWGGSVQMAVLQAAKPAAAAAGPATGGPAAGEVVFQVECTTSPGESVGVIGSCKTIGEWQASGAAVMKPSPYPTWKSDPIKVSGDNVEYKFVVLGADKAVVRWEPIEGNRKLKTGEPPKAVKFGEL